MTFGKDFFIRTSPRKQGGNKIYREQYSGIFAKLYDSLFESFAEDIDFYVNLGNKVNTPLLELGCGTGRLTLPLARAGHKMENLSRKSLSQFQNHITLIR